MPTARTQNTENVKWTFDPTLVINHSMTDNLNTNDSLKFILVVYCSPINEVLRIKISNKYFISIL